MPKNAPVASSYFNTVVDYMPATLFKKRACPNKFKKIFVKFSDHHGVSVSISPGECFYIWWEKASSMFQTYHVLLVNFDDNTLRILWNFVAKIYSKNRGVFRIPSNI